MLGHIGGDVLACGLGSLGHLERIGFQLWRRGQPAHTFGADVVINQVDVPVPDGGCGRQNFLGLEGFIAPLIGMRIPGRGRVHVPWRTVPVQRKGQRLPAGLRAQLFLTHIVRPATARLPNAATHDQHVDHTAIVHVHVIPVVHRRTDDDHRLAGGLFGVIGKFTGDMDDLVGRNAGDLFRPGRCAGHLVSEIRGDPVTTQTTVKPVVGAKQIEHRGHGDLLALWPLDHLDRNVARQHIGVIGVRFKLAIGLAAKVGEIDADDIIVIVVQNKAEFQFGFGRAGLFFKVPFAVFTPAIADRPVGRYQRVRQLIKGHGFPFRVVLFAQFARQIIRAQEPARHYAPLLFLKLDQHRKVGILAHVVLEIGCLAIKVEFTQDDVAKGHRQRGIRALFGIQPDIAELGGLGIIGTNDGGFGALVARFGIEMRIRRAGLGHIGPPKQQVTGVIPIGRFRHVGLFAPCHR